MRCISPIFLKRKGQFHNVPCGKCNFCLETKRADWTFRLTQELKSSYSAHFLTLTYEDSKTPISSTGLMELSKTDIQKFTKRLRKENDKINSKINYPSPSIRYYTVGEYGTETDRPHYHSILFNVRKEVTPLLQKIWGKGHIVLGTVTQASIHYVTKYVINRVGDFDNRQAPFALISKRSGGLGKSYIDTHRGWHKKGKRNYVNVQGVKGRLPRYYKDKIFTKIEKQTLAREAQELSLLNTFKELERLTQFHQDPWKYMNEQQVHAHEQITKRLNEKNLI